MEQRIMPTTEAVLERGEAGAGGGAAVSVGQFRFVARRVDEANIS
jgi:hypothetical protein